jgi:hypothetical protein
MTARSRTRLCLSVASATASLLLLLAGSATAATPAVAWKIKTVARPTSFSPEDTESETLKASVSATGGTFELRVNEAGTSDLSWNASAVEVEAAINALPTVGGVDGSASVSGGPGDELGSHPYEIAFGGALTGRFVNLNINEGKLKGATAKTTLVLLQEAYVQDDLLLVPKNLGSIATDGKVTLTDTLPPGVRVVKVSSETWTCGTEMSGGSEVVTCTTESSVSPLASARSIDIVVSVAPGTSGTLTNLAQISGGGAPAATATETEVPIDAPQPFGLTGGIESSLLDDAGAFDISAGDHSDADYTSFTLPSRVIADLKSPPQANAVETVKQIIVDLPPGVIGNARAASTCSLLDISSLVFNLNACPASSRVGSLDLIQSLSVGGVEPEFPIYNVAPEHGYSAEFAVFEPNLKRALMLYATVVGSGANAHIRITSAPQNVLGFELGYSIVFFGHPATIDNTLPEQTAFFTAPSDCGAPKFMSAIHVDSWEHPGRIAPDGHPDFSDPNWKSETSESPPVSGCESLVFNPTFSLHSDTNQADSATGLNVDLHVPQNEDPEGLATPPLRDVTVTLPKGLAVNPSSADGLQGCTEAQIQVQSNDPGNCPDASQIGTVEVDTPLLDHPLPGKVFVGTPDCAPCSGQDAEAGKLIHLLIEVNDPLTGTVIKLQGSTSANASNGQLVTSFSENPQFPVEDLKVTFKTGARAPLSTPSTCGRYETTTDLKPWSAPQSGPDATPNSSFNISSGAGNAACAGNEAALPNQPAFSAGTVSPEAGAFSPFVLKVSREPGSQVLKALNVTLPPGLTGKLAGVSYCPEAQINAAAQHSGAAEKASPSCPPASELGTANVGAGSGTPFYSQGHVYLAGPYKGAPLSIVTITPAVAGPFDLGTVVVRAGLYVDPETARITVRSDPFPTILAGIPLDIRSVAVDISRNQFSLNPTSCEPMALSGTAFGQSSDVALTSPFQVGGCNALGFKPKLAIKLKGGTKRAQHPALRAVLTYPKGSYANIAAASVALPHSEFLDQSHIKTICTRVQFAAGTVPGERCPPASVYGHARATTPLLDKPLEGPVYLRSSSHKLPDLVAALNGQIFVDLDGRIDTDKEGGIRSSFEVVPDAPVSKFTLEMQGAKKGLLVNSENICRKPQRATARFTGQNGKSYDSRPLVANGCKGKPKKRKSHGRR